MVAAPADATAPNGGGPAAPANPNGGGGTSIVVLSPSANASSPPFGSSSDQGGQSPPDGGSTALGPVSPGPGSPEDTAAIAAYEAAWLQASAIPLTAGGTVGVNAVGVNAPGNRFAIAPASTSHVTPAPVQNGRPAFVGSLVGPARSGLVRTISWGQPADEGPFDFVPPAEVSGTGARPESDRRFAVTDTYTSVGRVAAPSSRTSDLLTDFIPFDRTSLDRAIDRFLDHCDDLDAGSSHSRGTMEMLSEGMAVAVALTASKALFRSLWRSSDDVAIRAIEDVDGSAHFERAPGLPDPWSLGET